MSAKDGKSTAEKEERLYNYQVKSLERKLKEADEKLSDGTRHLFERVKYASEFQTVYKQMIELIDKVPSLEKEVAALESEHSEVKTKYDALSEELEEARETNKKLLESEEWIEKQENEIPKSIIDGVKLGKKLEEEALATRDDGKILLETAGLLGEQYQELAGDRQKLGDGIVDILTLLKENTKDTALLNELEKIGSKCEEETAKLMGEVEQEHGPLQ